MSDVVLLTEQVEESEENLEGMEQGRRGFCLITLAGLPDMAIMDDKALANALGVCPRTVRRMAARHELPPSIRMAGRSVWIAGKVRAWIAEREERAEDQAKTEIARIRKISN